MYVLIPFETKYQLPSECIGRAAYRVAITYFNLNSVLNTSVVILYHFNFTHLRPWLLQD